MILAGVLHLKPTSMARSVKHMEELTQEIQQLESRLHVLRGKLPPEVRFAMAVRRSQTHARDVSARQIGRVADTAVRQVRREAAQRRG